MHCSMGIGRLGRLLGGALLIALCVGCQDKSTDKAQTGQQSTSDKGIDGAPGAQASAPKQAPSAAPAKPTCPEGMVHLPAGRFLRGSDHGPDPLLLDERPAAKIEVKGYCLDKTEVTLEAYTACVDAGACIQAKEKSPPYAWADQFNWGKADRKNHPINGVSFEQAQAYCKHVGKRLPTETEWEYAARGTQNRLHPWGDAAPGPKLLNGCDTSCRKEGKKHNLPWIALFEDSDGFPYTAPVGSFAAGATPEGVLDLEGNVSEWVEGPACPYEKPECGAKGRVHRGSAWIEQYPGMVRTSGRQKSSSGEGFAAVGLRCAK